MIPAFYTSEKCRELDRTAIERYSIPGYELMCRAGQYAFDTAIEHWPDANHFVVVCGVGNNGGDGYVFARLAARYGYTVRVLQLGESAEIKGDALLALKEMESYGVQLESFSGEVLSTADVIVDAIFGTGLKRKVEGSWLAAIQDINSSALPVLSMDIPSGLNADNGHVMGDCVLADVSVSFIGRKQGMYSGNGPEYCGQIYFHTLDIPQDVYTHVEPDSYETLVSAELNCLAHRPRDVHKGNFGHVLVVGGNHSMSGAIRLAGEAALRTGAGLVSVATRKENALAITQARPELMCHGVDSHGDLSSAANRTNCVVLGPGLGQDDWARSLFEFVTRLTLPCVMDADALNILAGSGVKHENWILTPHPGEAARLLGITTQEIQSDRFAAVRLIQQTYGGVCVLKGAGTLIYDGKTTYICLQGNPGMATGGSGDVLSGILAGVMAQSTFHSMSLSQVARLGVYIHATAGDAAAMQGETGLIASDIIDNIRSVVLHG